jgi:hypothetical protein
VSGSPGLNLSVAAQLALVSVSLKRWLHAFVTCKLSVRVSCGSMLGQTGAAGVEGMAS